MWTMKRAAFIVVAATVLVAALGSSPAAAGTTRSAATRHPTCVSPNPGDTCVLVRVNNDRVIGNRKPFTVTAPVWLEVRVKGGEVDVTLLRDGELFLFTNGCGIACGVRIEPPGEYALFLDSNQTPSLTFTVLG